MPKLRCSCRIIERLAKIIMLISVKIQGNFIDFCTNICYTMVSTFKEDCLCIERLWASWRRGRKRTPQTSYFTGRKTGRKDLSFWVDAPTTKMWRANFETNPKLNETFEENISPIILIPILSHIAGQTIVKERTLIVFDEVQQLCEEATSLKYFCEDAQIITSSWQAACSALRSTGEILFPRRKGRY